MMEIEVQCPVIKAGKTVSQDIRDPTVQQRTGVHISGGRVWLDISSPYLSSNPEFGRPREKRESSRLHIWGHRRHRRHRDEQRVAPARAFT